MNPHDTPFGISPLRENYSAIAARARGEQSKAIGTAIIHVFHALGRVAASLVRRAGSLAFFTRTSRPMAAPRLVAKRQQSEVTLWIRPRAPFVLPASGQETITCDEGTVWITQGDSADYVLNAGQSFTLHPTDEVIITAMFAPALVRRTAEMH